MMVNVLIAFWWFIKTQAIQITKLVFEKDFNRMLMLHNNSNAKQNDINKLLLRTSKQ